MKKLTEIKKGHECIVTEIITKDDSILRKLMSMGILPGVKLRVILTFPAYVFEAGYTRVAVDKTIASAIIVDV
jgi:ferrous iron transport protein A